MKYSIITKKYNFKVEETIEYPVALPDTIHHRYFGITNRQLIIHQSFLWDGSSVPLKGFVQFITFGKYDADKYCKDASAVHDANCQLINLGFLDRKHKEAIDRLYEKMCIEGAKKVIYALYVSDRDKIFALNLSTKKKNKRWIKLEKEKDRQLARLPAWAARRYWAISKFGARTLTARYYPEKEILET